MNKFKQQVQTATVRGMSPKVAPHAWELANRLYKTVTQAADSMKPNWVKAKPGQNPGYMDAYSKANRDFSQSSSKPVTASPTPAPNAGVVNPAGNDNPWDDESLSEIGQGLQTLGAAPATGTRPAGNERVSSDTDDFESDFDITNDPEIYHEPTPGLPKTPGAGPTLGGSKGGSGPETDPWDELEELFNKPIGSPPKQPNTPGVGPTLSGSSKGGSDPLDPHSDLDDEMFDKKIR
jgi:hypothetical protein